MKPHTEVVQGVPLRTQAKASLSKELLMVAIGVGPATAI